MSVDDLYGSYVSLTGLFKEPIIGYLQSKMAEIRHLENTPSPHSITRHFFHKMTPMSRKPQAVTSRRSENHTDQSVAWK